MDIGSAEKWLNKLMNQYNKHTTQTEGNPNAK